MCFRTVCFSLSGSLVMCSNCPLIHVSTCPQLRWGLVFLTGHGETSRDVCPFDRCWGLLSFIVKQMWRVWTLDLILGHLQWNIEHIYIPIKFNYMSNISFFLLILELLVNPQVLAWGIVRCRWHSQMLSAPDVMSITTDQTFNRCHVWRTYI